MSNVYSIQAQARFFANDDTIDLTTDPGSSVLNMAYRKIVRAKKHPEFRFRRELDVTVNGTGEYSWSIKNKIDCNHADL